MLEDTQYECVSSLEADLKGKKGIAGKICVEAQVVESEKVPQYSYLHKLVARSPHAQGLDRYPCLATDVSFASALYKVVHGDSHYLCY